jgi:hypothetical protein
VEYLLLSWWTTATEVEGSTPRRWDFASHFRLVGPGVDEDLPPDRPLGTVLNDLGADGWELVAETSHSGRIGGYHGYIEASVPIHITWTFKRAAAPG